MQTCTHLEEENFPEEGYSYFCTKNQLWCEGCKHHEITVSGNIYVSPLQHGWSFFADEVSYDIPF